jgi:hypothetical protein
VANAASTRGALREVEWALVMADMMAVLLENLMAVRFASWTGDQFLVAFGVVICVV